MSDVPGMIQLRRADPYDTRSDSSAYVAVDSIESIQAATVGERSQGSRLTLRSGATLTVWENPDRVARLISQSLQGDQP